MSRQVDFRVQASRRNSLSISATLGSSQIFVDANIKLEPSQWARGLFHCRGSLCTRSRGALDEEGFDVSTNSRNIDLLQAGQCKVAASPLPGTLLQAFRFRQIRKRSQIRERWQ